MHLLKALSEKAAGFYGGGVVNCRELSDFMKNVSIHWLVVFKLLKFQGKELIVLHSDWEALLWFGIYKKLIQIFTVPCIQDRIQGSWRKQARKLLLRRMRTDELLRSYSRGVWDRCFKYTRDLLLWVLTWMERKGRLLPCLHTANAVWQNCRTACSSLSWKEKHVNGFQKPSHPGFCRWITYHITKLWGKLFKTWERRKIFR